MAGGVPKYVPLRSKPLEETDHTANAMFYLDFDELEQAVSPKTKAFILNSPHNPTGKMFSRKELEKISEIVQKNPQMTVIADEVYEYILFDPENSPHISISSLPGMFDRTLTLSSSGKTFR